MGENAKNLRFCGGYLPYLAQIWPKSEKKRDNSTTKPKKVAKIRNSGQNVPITP